MVILCLGILVCLAWSYFRDPISLLRYGLDTRSVKNGTQNGKDLLTFFQFCASLQDAVWCVLVVKVLIRDHKGPLTIKMLLTALKF